MMTTIKNDNDNDIKNDDNDNDIDNYIKMIIITRIKMTLMTSLKR